MPYSNVFATRLARTVLAKNPDELLAMAALNPDLVSEWLSELRSARAEIQSCADIFDEVIEDLVAATDFAAVRAQPAPAATALHALNRFGQTTGTPRLRVLAAADR